MATKKVLKAVGPVVKDGGAAYPKVLIDRSFASESSRRNIGTIVWYKRLIDATLVLLSVSCVFILISIIFAWKQPLPSLYGSALDGGLRPIDYTKDVNDPLLVGMRSALSTEEASREGLQEKGKLDFNVKPITNKTTPAAQ